MYTFSVPLTYGYKMFLEWDENKRRKNLKEHGVDFMDAALIFDNEIIIEALDDRGRHDEERIQALGQVDNEYFLVVYTWRKECRRIISAWKVNEDGKRRYQKVLSERAKREKK